MNYLKSSLLTLAVLLLAASHASAASIQFALNCQFSGAANDGTCTPGGSYGLVTLSDHVGAAPTDNYLDILVDLNAGWYATGIYLNIVPGSTPAGYTTWQGISGVNATPTSGVDNQGNTYLYFDLAVDATKPNTDPWSATIALNNGAKPPLYANLDPWMFATITSDPDAASPPNGTALVYLAVNQINCTGTGCTGNSVQQVIGSTSIVPEPASLLLFGSGLSALGMHARRRRNRNLA